MHFGLFCIGVGMSLFLPTILNELRNERTGDSSDLRVCEVLQKSSNSSAIDEVSLHFEFEESLEKLKHSF